MFEEKKYESAQGYPDGASDESPTRIEEGGKSGLLLNEEEATATVKAYPDDATPIYVTWGLNDPTNPRNWPVSCTIRNQPRLDLTFHSAEMEEMVDHLLRQLPELPDVSRVHHI
jgi:hypothetical protein